MYIQIYSILAILFFSRIECFLLDSVLSTSIFVSPNGNDANTGRTPDKPLKTIQNALNRIDSHSGATRDIFIELMQGRYELMSTLHISNKGNRYVTIRAYQGEDVRIIGGKRIPANKFKPVTNSGVLRRLFPDSRSHVLQINLTEIGITDYGHLKTFGFRGNSGKNNLEVFENGTPLRLARYPNKGYLNVSKVLDGGKSFKYISERPKHWIGEQNVWCHGFWYWSWADFAHKVTYFNPYNSTISLEIKPQFGMREGHYNLSDPTAAGFKDQGGYFRFFNVFSELDQPGEYFVDQETGTLYLWPIKDQPYTNNDDVYASVVNNCVEFGGGTKNVLIKDVTIEGCRQHGLIGYNVVNIKMNRVQVRNTGKYGMLFSGTNLNLTRNDIRNTDGGIYLKGGNIPTLTPSGNVIADNLISNIGRSAYVSSKGISIDGVGCRVHHNILFKTSYTGIRWSGNDHIMEYNHLSHTCSEASDCGAFQSGRSYSSRGNQIRFNHIRNTMRLCPGADVRGVMLDDELSGVNVSHNVFVDNYVHCNIGGGRDNVIRQNIMFNTSLNSMHFDARGLTTNGHTKYMLDKLHQVPYTNSLWRARYPKLAILTDGTTNPGAPEGNLISENIFQSMNRRHIIGNFRESWFNVTKNYFVMEDLNFYAPRYGDFRPRCFLNAFVNQSHFKSPVLSSDVGPRYTVGPQKRNITLPDLGYLKGQPPSPKACVLNPPRSPPSPTFLPDGSAPNTMFNITFKTGCLFAIDSCPNEPSLERKHRSANNQFYRNVSEERLDHSDESEQACLNRVPELVKRCGKQSSFAVIYGPSGASTLGGDGCFEDRTGCPLHGHGSYLARDKYAEQHDNAANNKHNCLRRALGIWDWCGHSPTYPITSIYRPTGEKVTAGIGCYIRPEKCPSDPSLNHMFYDGEGATNFATDISKISCLQRAEHFWRHCGSDPRYKVTAFFRPETLSKSYP